MNLIPVEYHGVHVVGPEQFFCALFYWRGEKKFLPVWMTATDGEALAALEAGEVRTRPTTHDLLADALSRLPGGVTSISLTSYYEGVFVATITAGAEDIDARASDAIILALTLDMEIKVSEEILTHAAIFVSLEELSQYADVDIAATSSNGENPEEEDPLAGVDFDEMLRSLGMDIPEAPSEESDDDSGDTEEK